VKKLIKKQVNKSHQLFGEGAEKKEKKKLSSANEMIELVKSQNEAGAKSRAQFVEIYTKNHQEQIEFEKQKHHDKMQLANTKATGTSQVPDPLAVENGKRLEKLETGLTDIMAFMSRLENKTETGSSSSGGASI
jgi:hypothetical protein